MEYKEVIGDLFKDNEPGVRLQCISHDCRMGKGIALEFKRRYPGMKHYLKQLLNSHSKFVPMAIHYDVDDTSEELPVINLITKRTAWDNPTMSSLAESLKVAKYLVTSKRYYRVTAPLIGCGLDGLEWKKVSQLIKETFKDTNVEIVIYKLKE